MHRSISSALLACFAALTLFLFTGCDHIQVFLGAKTRIATLPVDNVELRLNGDPGIAPGHRRRLIATFTDTTGKTWTTEGAGKGKILWNDLQVTPTLVTYKGGKISLAQDPRLSDGKTGHIDLTVPSHPALHASLDVPLRYDYPFVARYQGSDGSDGTAGTSGSSGSPGSLDPNNPSPGGDGSSGGNGSDGTNGSDGSSGPSVTARIALRPGTHPMLEAVVSAQGTKHTYYLIDPAGGTLTISSAGGSGGRGGKGGAAGQGGSGGIGSPNGSSGSNGLAGNDGLNGSDGSSGTVTITYDPAVAPYLSAIHANGAGNATHLIESPVPLLW